VEGRSSEGFSGGFFFRKEARMVIGIQKSRVMRIPKQIDPKMVNIREVLNSQRRNLIVTIGALEFWIAKTAIPTTMIRTTQ
jgi:hypothetical protein